VGKKTTPLQQGRGQEKKKKRKKRHSGEKIRDLPWGATFGGANCQKARKKKKKDGNHRLRPGLKPQHAKTQ